MAVATEIKKCCVCGKDLSGQPRKKDKNGKYWCMACDAQSKDASSPAGKSRVAGPSAACPDCGKSFPKSSLKDVGGVACCERCAYVRTLEGKAHGKGQRARVAASDPDARKRLVTLVVVAGSIGAFAAYWNWGAIFGR